MRASFEITLIFTASLVCAQEPGTSKTAEFYNAGGSLGPNSFDDADGEESSNAGGISTASGLEGAFSGGNFHPGLGAAPEIRAQFPTDGDELESRHTRGHGYFNAKRESPGFPVGPGESPSEQGFRASIPYEGLHSPAGYAIARVGGVSAGNYDIGEEPRPENVFVTRSASEQPESAGDYRLLVGERAPLGYTSETANSPDATHISTGKIEDSDGSSKFEVGEHLGRRPELGETYRLPVLPADSPSEQDGVADVYGSYPSGNRPTQFEDDVAIPTSGRFEDARPDYTTGVSFANEPEVDEPLRSHTTYDDNGFLDSERSYTGVEENNGGAGTGIFSPLDGLEGSPDVTNVHRDHNNVATYPGDDDPAKPNYLVLLISRRGGGSDSSNSLEAPEQRKSIVALQNDR
ncbi:uncharacterized protein LOC119396131 [Rhipicephalus sanguineus]|uniref:uncharacterized protein LOC119396131 n=1 Tax=Rhipicephalus sanguineus TaxID=34632 RepID=UPI001893B272|nr:uncharacterized protein LOC119396131 [Rhipicephalus sanguineus]